MKTSNYLKYVMLLSLFLFISCQTCCPPPIEGGARCDKIMDKGYINILDINVDALETEGWRERLEYIADFAAENDVDVILLQEIKGGSAAGTDNSADDLREILRNKHNIDHNLSTSWEIGISGFWRSANAILSRCEIKFVGCEQLPFVETSFKQDRDKKMKAISITRNVQMARLEIPERGQINVYNTHLCAKCEIDGRAEQLEVLLDFINSMEIERPGDHPSLLVGDFNFDLFDNQGAEKFLWENIINNGLIDAYADFVIINSGGGETLETLCEDEDNPDEHCTKGVTQLDDKNGRRIDYIFAKSPANIRAARVVFNELVNNDQPTVSDHAGVFISLELP